MKTKRIPNTVIEYTKAVAHKDATIYRTRHGWQIPMRDSEFWLATKSSLKRAKAFVDSLRGQAEPEFV